MLEAQKTSASMPLLRQSFRTAPMALHRPANGCIHEVIGPWRSDAPPLRWIRDRVAMARPLLCHGSMMPGGSLVRYWFDACSSKPRVSLTLMNGRVWWWLVLAGPAGVPAGPAGVKPALCEAGVRVTLIDGLEDPTGTTPLRTASGKPFEAGTRGFWRDYPNINLLTDELGLNDVFTPFTTSAFWSPAGLEATAPVFGDGLQLPEPPGQALATFENFKRLARCRSPEHRRFARGDA